MTTFSDDTWREIESRTAEQALHHTGWCVYILRSASREVLYTGISNRVLLRVNTHNRGKGARFTRTGGPWTLVFLMPMPSMSEALKTERRIKRMSRDSKLRILQQRNVSPPEGLPRR